MGILGTLLSAIIGALAKLAISFGWQKHEEHEVQKTAKGQANVAQQMQQAENVVQQERAEGDVRERNVRNTASTDAGLQRGAAIINQAIDAANDKLQ